MKTRLVLWVMALAVLLPGPAAAERYARRTIGAGDVTGLELGLEGRTTATPGARLRWLLTLYEIVGQQELRPAPGATFRVAASFRREEPIATLTADRHGRAQLDVALPADLDEGFDVVVEAVSASRVRRRFQVSVVLAPDRRVELFVDRERVAPGATVRVFGRAVTEPTGRPMAGASVLVRVEDGRSRALTPELRAETGPAGEFSTTVVAPDRPGSIRIGARHGEGRDRASSTVTVSVDETVRPELIVRCVPERAVVPPGEAVFVDVVVRRPDGRPVRGAVVTPPAPRRRRGGSAGHGDLAPVRTDERGRARVAWQPPAALPARGFADHTGWITATRTGVGSVDVRVNVRVARGDYLVGAAPEGGALVPGLPGRVYARVLGSDGTPAPAGVPVVIESSRFGELSAETGRGGVAVVDVGARTAGRAPADRCGGSTAAAATVTAGRGDGATEVEVCLPVDPDATLVVRPTPSVVVAGQDLAVRFLRAERVRHAPVALTLLARRSDGLEPVGYVVVPGARSQATLQVPEDISGELLVRARPLIGRGAQEVRGGSALAWSVRGDVETEVGVTDHGAVRLTGSGGTGGPLRGAVVVLPFRDGEALLSRLRAATGPSRFAHGAGPVDASVLSGALAARAPRDVAAPAVLRGEEILALPAPSDPVRNGVLRDPWRARARFVAGRLALVIRAIEAYVAGALPDRIEDVAGRSGRGFRFNREVLAAVADSDDLGAEGARGLGGEPLTLEDLEALDPAFTYDNMARRITRQRLLGALVLLRSFVRQRGLDLSWAWRGDPSSWLPRLLDHSDAETGHGPLSRQDLYDGWGRLLQIRRAPGGRARFEFLSPLPAGYELVSAGPDGRFGTGDDVVDPLARVLPSAGVYAEAVGEDELLARLRGVELGRATAERLAEVFQVSTHLSPPEGETPQMHHGWSSLPGPVPPRLPLSQLTRPWIFADVFGGDVSTLRGGSTTIQLELDDEPRRYLAVGVVWSTAGGMAVASAPLSAGVPLLLDGSVPPRLRVGETLSVPVTVARLEGAPAALVLEPSATGVLSAELDRGADPRLAIGPAGTATAWVRLSARAPGEGRLRIMVRGARGGPARTLEVGVRADGGGLLRSQVAAGALGEELSLPVEVPTDAVSPRGVLVVDTPSTLVRARALEGMVDSDPAILAWAHALGGGEVPEAIAVAVERAIGDGGVVDGALPELSTACAVVAWAVEPEEATSVHAARRLAVSALLSRVALPSRAPLTEESAPSPDVAARRVRTHAALLAALATATSSEPGRSPLGGDPLDRLVAGLRDGARLSLRTHRGDPGAMARSSAALLLADPEDARGRAMLGEARGALVDGLRGGLVLGTADGGAGEEESIAATAALAVAARQVEDDHLAGQLAAGLAARSPVAMSLGGEAAFWLLAAAVYGVFGVGELEAVTLQVGRGEVRRIPLAGGRAVAEIDLPRAGRRRAVRVRPEGNGSVVPVVRVETRYARPPEALEGSPLSARVEGDPGHVGETAAFEVTVTNGGDEAVARPVLLVALPAASVATARVLEAIEAAPAVESVEPVDGRGVLRVRLAPLAAGADAVLPLPVRWVAAGRVRGLALATFAADRSWQLSVTPDRELEISAP